jgi:hypothetical protein
MSFVYMRNAGSKITSLLNQPKNKSIKKCFIDVFESWECAERHTKFIINSVRAYEFWGYEWWLPLWDTELMELWCRTPFKCRLDKRIYRKYVDKAYSGFMRNENPPAIVNLNPKYNSLLLRDILGKLKILHIARAILLNIRQVKNKILWKHEYYGDIHGRYSAIKLNIFKYFYSGKENINSFFSKMYIDNLDNTYSDKRSQM